ncbi:MAG: protoheme IX farnesyltransferase [Rhodospirillaceae bacterium]|nr:protoheme IX farnesyltransferase [Rhodospirillaceae bacterium]MBT3494580.1 protoheme IX farnesyltransferase [Rhodospirillaceae bacterium]MBT3782641.1 protoheme IX farnesyltransferase [Rhodospirillaceae bacterium]MBT3974886.1 protoheme IX farnesyltransferase [Rhodospirillaceae bacterium]MBT4171416.1 protoheme IX farnesyltransferase [Rhodospirillaceae bacterium]
MATASRQLQFSQLQNVFKLRIGFAIMLTALAGLAMTPNADLSILEVSALAVAVLVSAAAAGALNQYLERDLDGNMARTANRPFVTGVFQAGPKWLCAIILLLAGAVILAWSVLNFATALYVFLGAFFYGVVYTVWLKRRSWMNIVIGGLSGSFAVLAGVAAADPDLATAPVLLAVVLFLWTPPHFWSLAMALHKDYAAAKVPMLPVVIGDGPAARVILAHTVALVALSLLPFAFGMGWLYLAGAVIGGGYFILRAVQLVRAPGPVLAMKTFFASLIQLTLLLVTAIAEPWIMGLV